MAKLKTTFFVKAGAQFANVMACISCKFNTIEELVQNRIKVLGNHQFFSKERVSKLENLWNRHQRPKTEYHDDELNRVLGGGLF